MRLFIFSQTTGNNKSAGKLNIFLIPYKHPLRKMQFELTWKFSELMEAYKDAEARALVERAPRSPEADGLQGYLYYYGIGGKMESLDMAFVMFERGERHDDSLSLYMLGLMCDRVETPDQKEGGFRKKYDRCHAVGLMERCVKGEGMWAMGARVWLGEYYMDEERGNDLEKGLLYFEIPALSGNDDALKRLIEHYSGLAKENDYADENVNRIWLKWQKTAYEFFPESESFNYGMLLTGVSGIEENIPKALQLFEDDYNYGYARGALALERYYRQTADDTSLPDRERTRAAFTGAQWAERAKQLDAMKNEE